jgi:trk system potassium uptake protein TrkH
MGWHALGVLWLALACGGIALEHGFPPGEAPLATGPIHLAQAALLALYWLQRWFRRSAMTIEGERAFSAADGVLLGVMASGSAIQLTTALASTGEALGAVGWRAVEVSAVMLLLKAGWQLNAILARRLPRPGVLFPLSFVVLIGIGTALLMLPRATPAGYPIGWSDALFTMTSAVCVTGLTVRETATGFTPFGQFVIALFIQLGALGILIFGSTLVMLLGRSLSLSENVSLSRMLQDQPLHRLRRFAVFIVATTLIVELIGAAAMYPLWQSDGMGLTIGHRLGFSAFHAISAFCNAGFDITGQSLSGYRYSVLAHGIIAPLIVLGGLGFPALDNLWQVLRDRLRRWFHRPVGQGGAKRLGMPGRLTLTTKLVLTTTAGLYLVGVMTISTAQVLPYFYQAFGWGQTAHVDRPGALDAAALGQVTADSSFTAITARTAGFHTVPMTELHQSARLSVMTQMLVGGSPGSSAGGFKTTVLALLILAIVGSLRPGKETAAFGRSIAGRLVTHALTLVAGFILLIVTATYLITLVESDPLERIVFEVISAATTTGLSMGLSGHPDLQHLSQGVLIATMLIGRVGPLTLLGMVLVRQRPGRTYAYAHEDVALG